MKKHFRQTILKTLFLCLFLGVFTAQPYAQINLKRAVSAVKKSPCDAKQKSLNSYLKKLNTKTAENKVATGSFKTYLASAQGYLDKIKSQCPDLDISKEEAELKNYSAEYESGGGADSNRQAEIRKGYYDKAIDNLVASTHPAYNEFYRAKSRGLVLAFQHYRHKKPTDSYKSVKECRTAFTEIKSSNDDLDFSLIDTELTRLEGLLQTEYGDKITTTLNNENAVDYFRNISTNLHLIYNESNYASDAANGLTFTQNHVKLYTTAEHFKSFTKEKYLQKVAEAKAGGTYPSVQFYTKKVVAALEDYPNFINKSKGAYHNYLDFLNNIGVKGDPQQELKHLEATKVFCELLLKFAPNDPTASQWLREVNNQIGKTQKSIIYASNMHQSHLGEMLFSTTEVTIGNEAEDDFTTHFKSGDYVFATVYLPAKLRKLTDSYAANDVRYRVNGSIISEASSTAVWVTTPMQEKNYLQFAIIPNTHWNQKYSANYINNKLRTHEHIANALARAGAYSGITIDVEITFRGTHSKINGSFTIDLSNGTAYLQEIISSQENSRLSNAKLPKAGMSNIALQNQALAIMRQKSEGAGKTYIKAIITSTNWGYDKSWAGITVSRSIVIALVSKEYDGKCMYQYFNFLQQEKGNGTYNSNLEFAGAGTNVYISCNNAN